MSRSNNTEINNPAKIFVEWSGSKGCLKYFDKTRGDKGEEVFIKLPFRFLVLDKLSTVKGFSDADNSGFWANEVRNVTTDPLTVRTKKGIVWGGLYKNMNLTGAVYCQSVYIAFYNEKGDLEIGNFQIYGAAIGPWIDFNKGKDIYKYAVSITGVTEAKKGNNTYYVPVFAGTTEIKPETEAKAIELDKELQNYMESYFKRSGSEDHGKIEPKEELAPDDVMSPAQKKAAKDFVDPASTYSGVDTFEIDYPSDDGNADDLPF